MLANGNECIYVSEIFRSVGFGKRRYDPVRLSSFTKLFSKDKANLNTLDREGRIFCRRNRPSYFFDGYGGRASRGGIGCGCDFAGESGGRGL